MNGKYAKAKRKSMNKVKEDLHEGKKTIANDLVRELFNAPFKYRFVFAVKLIFKRLK